MSKPVLYAVPGLGADQRMFIPLQQQGIEMQVLSFIPPVPGESLPQYAARMALQIDATKPFNLLGVSLGGMLAVEMAEALKPRHLLLISTLKHKRELPTYFRIAHILPVHRILSGRFMRKYAPRERTRDMDPQVRQLLGDMRLDADPLLIKWALKAVLKWKRAAPMPGYRHLHGTHDMLFPQRFIGGQEKVPGGGHTMVMTHAAEVAAWIREQLGN